MTLRLKELECYEENIESTGLKTSAQIESRAIRLIEFQKQVNKGY